MMKTKKLHDFEHLLVVSGGAANGMSRFVGLFIRYGIEDDLMLPLSQFLARNRRVSGLRS